MAGDGRRLQDSGGAAPAGAARLRARLRHLRNAIGLAIVAFGLVWSTGFRGFMPLDQSIVWDAAWRMLGGQAPFADFVMPNGLVPAAIQAALFGVLGVSWTSYVLHAALANAAFAVLVYAFLARVFGRGGPAVVYGLAAAAMLYPPIGTPYMDQHAVLFSALLLLLVAGDARRPLPSAWIWLLLPPVAALAFLSKQTPSAWALLWAAAMLGLLALRRGHATRASVLALAIGALATAVAGVAALTWLGASTADAFLSLITLPGEIGQARLTWAWIAPRLGDLAKPGLLVVVAALIACWPMLLRPEADRAAVSDWVTHAAATGLVVVAVLYVLLTDNSAWFGLGALPLAAGLAHALLERRLAGQGGPRRHLGWIVAAAIALQALLQFADTSLPRAANELRRADWETASRGETVDRRLAGLVWALPPAVARDAGGESAAERYRDLLQHLRAEPGGFVLIGDAAVLYALSGRASAFPALWFHPGLTYPLPGHAARAEFDAKLVRALAKYDVRTIVIDGDHTWTGARAADFAPLAACLARGEATRMIGRFRVVTVPSGCGQK